jgi:hypothetical protein
MEDVLAVYTRPRDPDYPLVCLDETSKQLIAETRVPIPMKRGRVARIDYEYARNGTANLFMLFTPLESWRHVVAPDLLESSTDRSLYPNFVANLLSVGVVARSGRPSLKCREWVGFLQDPTGATLGLWKSNPRNSHRPLDRREGPPLPQGEGPKFLVAHRATQSFRAEVPFRYPPILTRHRRTVSCAEESLLQRS